MLRVLPAELAPLRCEGAVVTVELAVSVVTAWHLERAVPDTARIRVHASEPELRTEPQTRKRLLHLRVGGPGCAQQHHECGGGLSWVDQHHQYLAPGDGKGRLWLPNEVLAVRGCDGLCPAVHVELSQDVLDVDGHCLRADRERPGDVTLFEAVREQAENLGLTAGEISRIRPVWSYATHERGDSCDELARVTRFDKIVVGTDEQA